MTQYTTIRTTSNMMKRGTAMYNISLTTNKYWQQFYPLIWVCTYFISLSTPNFGSGLKWLLLGRYQVLVD